MFHCGSRGFGHQVATDYLQVFLKVMESKYRIKILDRELACAPFHSPEGKDYFAAMKCGINMSFANRQVILHRIREVFSEVFGRSAEDLGMHMVYDVAHNTAKLERHVVNGKEKTLLVHRKGATRAFGPGMEGIPPVFRDSGQPVIIGGSMETGSYLLVGTPGGEQTFFSTAHGSGRTMSRTKARKLWRGRELQQEMEARGIYVRTASWPGLAEEAGGGLQGHRRRDPGHRESRHQQAGRALHPGRQCEGVSGDTVRSTSLCIPQRADPPESARHTLTLRPTSQASKFENSHHSHHRPPGQREDDPSPPHSGLRSQENRHPHE